MVGTVQHLWLLLSLSVITAGNNSPRYGPLREEGLSRAQGSEKNPDRRTSSDGHVIYMKADW